MKVFFLLVIVSNLARCSALHSLLVIMQNRSFSRSLSFVKCANHLCLLTLKTINRFKVTRDDKGSIQEHAHMKPITEFWYIIPVADCVSLINVSQLCE